MFFDLLHMPSLMLVESSFLELHSIKSHMKSHNMHTDLPVFMSQKQEMK